MTTGFLPRPKADNYAIDVDTWKIFAKYGQRLERGITDEWLAVLFDPTTNIHIEEGGRTKEEAIKRAWIQLHIEITEKNRA